VKSSSALSSTSAPLVSLPSGGDPPHAALAAQLETKKIASAVAMRRHVLA